MNNRQTHSDTGDDQDWPPQDAIRTSELYQQIVEHGPDAILLLDAAGIIRFVNSRAQEMFGRPAERMIGSLFGFPFDGGHPQELSIVRSGELPRTVEMRVSEVQIADEAIMIASLRDITELVQQRTAYHELSQIDELTGLYNRRGMEELLSKQMETSKRLRVPLSVLYLDLDNMKSINDEFGHTEGDYALSETAELLRDTFRKSDLIARVGGDEFIAVSLETSQSIGSESLISRIQQRIAEYNSKSRRPYKLSISCGSARYDEKDERTMEQLLHAADTAMYKNKRLRRSKAKSA